MLASDGIFRLSPTIDFDFKDLITMLTQHQFDINTKKCVKVCYDHVVYANKQMHTK